MDVGIFYHNVIKVYYERCKDPRLPDIERLHDIFDNLAEYLDLTYLPRLSGYMRWKSCGRSWKGLSDMMPKIWQGIMRLPAAF